MRAQRQHHGWLGGLALLAACSGEATTVARPQAARAPISARPDRGDGGELLVTGLRGTLSQEDIHRVMERRLGAFQRCFTRGLKAVPYLSGDMLFAFIVDPAGRVTAVEVVESSLGHHATEQCMREHAQRARFPKPAGGAPAEFSWGFGIDPPEDAPMPLEVTADRIGTETPEVLEVAVLCGAAGAQVTAYMDAAGQPLAVGATAGAGADPAALQCVVEQVARVALPTPGGDAGKVRFALP